MTTTMTVIGGSLACAQLTVVGVGALTLYCASLFSCSYLPSEG